ncbi:hypothetical protein RM530_02950 [Algiphilus sp. W345]|uniref:PilC beta-propeller domain-containing protein n=1 Tax=Banduia mediterranea TaxID=3075609 RepID=A0ABU2WEP2_9GAMM|nr:hypothetical protein [Algiphilus sp. W345]MDT0496326.1 hypothetical protein [Algiphilus sp. W345]
MSALISKLIFRLTVALIALVPGFALAGGLEHISSDSVVKYTSLPVTSVDSAIPQAMITLAKDHQLFMKAFNDYVDLDRDGNVEPNEVTYNHGFDYYGYFDSYKCYDYSTTSQRFVPTTEYDKVESDSAASSTNLAAKYCSGNWSGNFLNWATMARIDAVRKILFGGKRSIDNSISYDQPALTVLERTYLPNDAHSWAKYYNGSDIDNLTPFNPPSGGSGQANGITICNTTLDSSFSKTSGEVTAPPLIRVAEGNYSLWAANERWQCLWSDEKGASNGNDLTYSGIAAASSNPDRSNIALGTGVAKGDYVVRIEVCTTNFEEGDRCKKYPDGTYKPIGLLQEYGDGERMWFGLIAGSYSKNKSGGAIMKNAEPFTDEINVSVDGRFIKVAGLNGVGSQPSKSNGIVNALSLYRIIKYSHDDGTYGVKGNSNDNCTFRLAEFGSGTCQNWGNPFGEGFFQAINYYGRGKTIGDFQSNDSNEIPGLNPPTNIKPSIEDSNSCASLNVVAFNNSTISYDGDELDGNSDGVGSIGSTLTAAQLTDIVGAGEGVYGNKFFVGENGSTSQGDAGHQVCTAKTVSSLGAVKGLCPEAPRVEGTFKIAGVAHYAHLNDINDDVDGVQTVKMYAVNLASATPQVHIPVPGGGDSVLLLPSCQNLDLKNANGSTVSGLSGACAIVDFKIVKPYSESAGVGSGKFYVNWENGEQGGDYDQDMWGVIDYKITASEITVTTDAIGYSGGSARMGFGYIISGTTKDGAHYHSGGGGDNNGNSTSTPYRYTDPTGATDCSAGNGCQISQDSTSYTYAIGASDAELLKDPLWYAAKWGGFDDLDGDNKPSSLAEWDNVDADGNPNPDGDPDNYFHAVEPRQLEAQLRRVFDQIIGRVAAGTAASVVANAREGEGAIYQALFEPTRSDKDGNEVRWLGSLHSLWVDSNGYLREDGDQDAVLDGYGTDPVVELFFDDSSANQQEHKTKVRRYSGDPADSATTSSVVSIDDLRTLWDARERLAAISNSNINTQRPYGSSATTGRYIFTFLDLNQNGSVDSGEIKPFVPASFGSASGTYGVLNAPSSDTADKLVKYIRGDDQSGVSGLNLRPRTLDYDGDGTPETMRLGDIVQSTPTVAAAPSEAFDLLYDDASYGEFRRKYRNRRNVVYVGANDGMLHAFNAGFYDAENTQFKTSYNGETAHPLGSELWAYVPYNLLPHLTWLSDPDYPHVWYVDAKPRVFDARIFNDDSDHPNGWGTVLAIGFRFGGGDLTLPAGNYADAFSAFSNWSQNQAKKRKLETHSAIVLLDVTNPEKAPTLLAEFSDPDLGFTTSFPTVIAMSQRGNQAGASIDDDWYLVFGSGPDNLNSISSNITDAESTRSGLLYVLDLKSMKLVNGKPYDLGNAASKSFVGDPVTVDWDLDFMADSVYFGTIGGDAAAPSGKLFKFQLANGVGEEQRATANWAAPRVMVDPGTASVSTPTVTFDPQGNRWVFAGTGRLFGDPDKASTPQQYLFGAVDSSNSIGTSTLYNFSNFVDVSDATVATNGSVTNVIGVGSEGALSTLAVKNGGWRLDLELPGVAERSVTQMSLLGDILFASAFTPSTDLCGGEGTSQLYGLYYKTGAPKAALPTFGTTTSTVDGQTLDIGIRQVTIGAGLASSPSLHTGVARDQRGITIFTQTSTGAIVNETGLVTERARSGEIDWRERF